MANERNDAGPPPDDQADRLEEPRTETIRGRDFAGAGEMAADQRRQRAERDAGLGAGGSDNRDARHPAQSEGEVPEDDLD